MVTKRVLGFDFEVAQVECNAGCTLWFSTIAKTMPKHGCLMPQQTDSQMQGWPPGQVGRVLFSPNSLRYPSGSLNHLL
jgi:hypothetical protein